jgi:pyruvate,water dikinase
VLRSLSEGDGLEEGDILVAETTAPPWTPLFATAAAVVTDTGGILSHSAVVAREYRIPAVVGTGAATATIRSGQTVEVDGDRGIVRVLSEGGS